MEKEFDPTQKRLQELRKRGQVSRGKVLNRAVSFTVGFLAVLLIVDNRLQSIKQWSTECFEGRCANYLLPLRDSGMIVIVAAIAAIVVSFCLDLWASNWMLSKERGAISLSNFNPAEGLRGVWTRIRGLPFYLLCFLVFAGALGFLTCELLTKRFMALLTGGAGVAESIISDMYYVLGWGGGIGVAFGLLDDVRERFLFNKKNRMSLQELKDEFKQDEGDPLMKALRKGMYDELMLANLEKRVRRSEFILIERSL